MKLILVTQNIKNIEMLHTQEFYLAYPCLHHSLSYIFNIEYLMFFIYWLNLVLQGLGNLLTYIRYLHYGFLTGKCTGGEWVWCLYEFGVDVWSMLADANLPYSAGPKLGWWLDDKKSSETGRHGWDLRKDKRDGYCLLAWKGRMVQAGQNLVTVGSR